MLISCIICTRNRAYGLKDCLDAVAFSALQAHKKDDVEVVIVDNGSSDNTAPVIEDYAQESLIKIRYVFEKRPGLSAARNAGIAAASGDLIIFTDDDCRLSPDYICQFLQYDAQDGDELVMRSGSVVLGNQDDLPITIRTILETKRWKRPMTLQDEGHLLGGAVIGCNMATRRTIVTKIGNFDETLGAGTSCPAAEDTDYCYRAYLAGVALECVPDLVVAHHHGRKQLAEKDKLLSNYAIGNGALCLKYLFIYPRFTRHLLWAAKRAAQSMFDPSAKSSFSPRDNFYFMLVGVYRYAFTILANRFRQSRNESL